MEPSLLQHHSTRPLPSRCGPEGPPELAGVDPVRHLADVLPILSRKVRLKDIPALLPAPWKAAHPDVAAAIAPSA